MQIAIVGGTGEEGIGLAVRFCGGGHRVVIGSRSAERAVAAAARVNEAVPDTVCGGATNDEAARAADIVLVAVPFAGLRETMERLREIVREKLVVSVVVPMEFGQGGPRAAEVPEGSAAELIRAVLGEGSRVVAGFQQLPAGELMRPDVMVEADVLVCGGSKEDRAAVMELVRCIAGARAVDAGPLRMARYIEPITVLLVDINRRYRAHTSIRVTGLPG